MESDSDIPDLPAELIVGETATLVVAAAASGARLDWYLAQQYPQYSRVHLRKVINALGVKVNDQRVKAAHRLQPGDRVAVTLPELPREYPAPEDIPLHVLYEDEVLAVINKPAGMVVHPGRGHWTGTLAAALQFHFDRLSEVAGPTRPGIVHRLDRDTSGVLVVAKDDQTHMRLAEQFELRTVEKEYFAIVAGAPDRDRDLVDLPIGIHPYQREKMAIRRDHPSSKPAQTFYEVSERFAGFASVKALPKSGRTHQIRLHLSSVGCPVLCDRLYGGRAQITLEELHHRPEGGPVVLARQALHARRLRFTHPYSGQPLEMSADLPADIQAALDALRSTPRSRAK